MNKYIHKSVAHGKVIAPPSKSIAHRALICAALAEGESVLSNLPLCDDIKATLHALTSLGAHCKIEGHSAIISSGLSSLTPSENHVVFAGESGSTLRFLLPLALRQNKPVTFYGAGKLMQRPLQPYYQLFDEFGISYKAEGQSLTVQGKLPGGTFHMAGDVSSQFISGLLFLLPTLNEDSKLILTPPVVSRPYIDMTIAIMQAFGVHATWENTHTLFVAGKQTYTPTSLTIEGDCSAGSVLAAFGLLGGEVEVEGLPDVTTQADAVFPVWFKALTKSYATLSLKDCPDLGPLAFVLATLYHGATFTEASRLRDKESDRLEAMQTELAKVGGQMDICGDIVTIKKTPLHPSPLPLCGHGDHRIVMALTLLLTTLGGEITDTEAIAKSFPDFWDTIAMLGIAFENTN